jgi:aryl-alcohol dehydrogenase-like predicted oxidoreductase
MKYTTIPKSDIKVSKICLGTMTFGNQNSESEAHEQMDYALSQGVNFFDTAEMYAVPPSAATQGKTEEYIGSWFTKNGNRKDIVLASKIAGPNRGMDWIRDDLSYSKENITNALDKSLKRLKTDYIDLYQLHWPERNVNIFGQRDYKHDPTEKWQDNFEEILRILDGFVTEGKIRHVGISNETPYGTMKFLEASKKDLPRVKTIQNAYSLINRGYENGLAEISIREEIGLLAYSPLAFGTLSGKYIKNPKTVGRVSIFPRYSRYSSKQSTTAIQKYLTIAEKYNLSLTHLALAFVNQQPFLTSNIIGATTIDQLKENISSIEIDLSDEILGEIESIHALMPNPAP